jgi:hypothetical protein
VTPVVAPVVSPTAVAPAATASVAPDDAVAEPVVVEPPLNRPPKFDIRDHTRAGAAIQAAKKLLGPAVADLVAREIEAYRSFGFRVDERSVVARVVDELLTDSTMPAA